MNRTYKSILGFTISATDGEIGKVKDVYFDDETMTVRYLVVETGNWLVERKILLSPQSLLQPDWTHKTFPVNLTREQVKHSPDINTDRPVTRQEEELLYEHYAWNNYWEGSLWAGGIGTTGMVMPMYGPLEAEIAKQANDDGQGNKGNPHLRSAHYIKGYNIKATDDNIGEVEDFILDDTTWKIVYFVVDTGNWFPGKKVIISPAWIKDINWDSASVKVNTSAENVKNSPEYDSENIPSADYEKQLHQYYSDHLHRE